MPPSPIVPLPVTLCILAWRKPEALAQTLQSLQQAGVLKAVAHAYLFMQEPNQQMAHLAQKFGLHHYIFPENVGIWPAWQHMTNLAPTEQLLIIEEDCPVVTDASPEDVHRQLREASQMLERKQVQKVRLRHLSKPGEKFDARAKYNRYYATGWLPKLRRFVRPGKAQRLKGLRPYCMAPAGPSNTPIFTQSNHLSWTNQSILTTRYFLQSHVFPQVAQHPCARTVGQRQDIERSLNSRHWRRASHTIGLTVPGVFTHV